MGGMSAQLGCPGVGLGCVDVCVCVSEGEQREACASPRTRE